ncbi:hypothetical protein ACET3Z_032839 [Daucus carota]
MIQIVIIRLDILSFGFSQIYSCLKDEYTNTHLKEDDGRMRIEVISGLKGMQCIVLERLESLRYTGGGSKDIWLDKNKQPDISFMLEPLTMKNTNKCKLSYKT